MISCFKGSFRLTSARGNRTLFGKTEFHKGIDLVGLDDTNVYAVCEGTIDSALYEKNGFGYYITQLLDDGRRIFYAHLKKGSICVKAGQKVRKGDMLGVMGASGNVTGAHTHLELRPAGRGSESIDICEFCDIPNKEGVYFYKEKTMEKFKDTHDSYAKKEIEDLQKKGILAGDGNGFFRPHDALTREEAAILISRAINYVKQ